MKVATIFDLSDDILYLIAKDFLAIDDCLALEEVVGKKMTSCIQSVLKVHPDCKAIGIRNLMWPEELDQFEHNGNHELKAMAARFELHQPWKCSDHRHHAKVFFESNLSLMRKTDELYVTKVLKLFPQVESLDLRGVPINRKLLETILAICPMLNCLKINFCIIDLDALELLTIYPQLIHLSCDNFSITAIANHLLARQSRPEGFLRQLTELEFVAFPLEKIKMLNFQQLESLVFFSFQVYCTPNHPVVDCFLSESIATITADNLMFLKIKSNCEIHNAQLIWSMIKHEKLTALNISCPVRGIKDFRREFRNQFFRAGHILPKLESLTFDLYDSNHASQFVELLARRPVEIQTLQMLRLLSFTLTKKTMATIERNLGSYLTKLELIDVKLQDIAHVFNTLQRFPNLNELRIEFTFQNDYPHLIGISDYSQMRKYFAIPKKTFSDSIAAIRSFIQHSPSLKEMVLIHWPRLRYYHFGCLKQAINDKKIKFFMLQC